MGFLSKFAHSVPRTSPLSLLQSRTFLNERDECKYCNCPGSWSLSPKGPTETFCAYSSAVFVKSQGQRRVAPKHFLLSGIILASNWITWPKNWIVREQDETRFPGLRYLEIRSASKGLRSHSGVSRKKQIVNNIIYSCLMGFFFLPREKQHWWRAVSGDKISFV